MIKKPGTFSNKYMSNPLTNQPSSQKRNDKENRNPNSNSNSNKSQSQSYENQALFQSEQGALQPASVLRPFQRSPSPVPKPNKSENKLKMEWQKNEKNEQLLQQIKRLKRENWRLRQQLKKTNKVNLENICGYEAYIKDLEGQGEEKQNKIKYYGQQLKYCLIWMIQAFSLGRDVHQHHLLLEKLSRNKMSQVIHKLSPIIQQLQIHKNLEQISKRTQNQSYLIQQKSSRISYPHLNNLEPSFEAQEFNQLLQTFDLQRQSQIPHDRDTQQNQGFFDNIARKLFVNQDTFGQQIGQHEISEEYYEASKQTKQNEDESKLSNNKVEKMEKVGNQSKVKNEKLDGSTVTIMVDFVPESNDYLKLKKGQQVKLLRKVGDLWIAQYGISIGYISEQVFS